MILDFRKEVIGRIFSLTNMRNRRFLIGGSNEMVSTKEKINEII